MKAKEKIRKISDSLKEAGVVDADREAETIVMRISGIGRESLYIDDPDLEANVSEEVDNALARRALGEPLQYILGSLEFYGLTINVGKGVLIPRPETELMVDEVIKYVRSTKKAHAKVLILDLCTGSGCIALALAANIRGAEVSAADSSATALKYAVINAEINNVNNITFFEGNLFEPVGKCTFDVIVSNPPYIRTDDIDGLQKEIRDWEPVTALDGGEDGLNYYRAIIGDLRRFLSDKGRCYLEIGYDQREGIDDIVKKNGLHARYIRDLAGIDRIAVLSF